MLPVTCGTSQGLRSLDNNLMGEDGVDFPPVDTGKPFKKLFHGRAVLEVLEQGGDGHTRSHKHPRSAELIRVPFDCGALFPICHFFAASNSALTVVYHEQLLGFELRALGHTTITLRDTGEYGCVGSCSESMRYAGIVLLLSFCGAQRQRIYNLSPAGGETQRGGLRYSTHGD